MMTDEPEPIPLMEWLSNQKERAKEVIDDESIDDAVRERWLGEYRLIHAIQTYYEQDIIVLEDTDDESAGEN